MTQVVEQDLQARVVALQVLALSPTLSSGNLAAFRTRSQCVIPGSNLILLREDGQQLINPTGAPPTSDSTSTLGNGHRDGNVPAQG